MSGDFQCASCDKWTARYDFENKEFVCRECGHHEPAKEVAEKCYGCGRTIRVRTWFDPSSCPFCHKSRVD